MAIITIYTAKKIPILIDEEDYELANRGRSLFVKPNGFVVISKRLGPKKVVHIYLHKRIAGCDKGNGFQVDHIDGNRLNNSRKNLRICTHHQNQYNKPKRAGQSKHSKYKGITKYITASGATRYSVRIRANKKHIPLGSFDTELEAAEAYDQAAIIYHGEFARLNFPIS